MLRAVGAAPVGVDGVQRLMDKAPTCTGDPQRRRMYAALGSATGKNAPSKSRQKGRPQNTGQSRRDDYEEQDGAHAGSYDYDEQAYEIDPYGRRYYEGDTIDRDDAGRDRDDQAAFEKG